MNYYEKYLKYKNKYLKLKELSGSGLQDEFKKGEFVVYIKRDIPAQIISIDYNTESAMIIYENEEGESREAGVPLKGLKKINFSIARDSIERKKKKKKLLGLN